MPIVEFSQRDLLRGTVVDPSWYRCFIEEIDAEGEDSKDKKSTNYKVDVTILFDGDTGDSKFRGVPILYNFNSKALGFTMGLFLACGLELKSGERYRLEACAGREVDIFIGNKPYLGRTLNDVNHQYRAPKPEITLVETPPAEQPAS
jgi:hypothetical protein